MSQCFFTLPLQNKITGTWSYRFTGLRHTVQAEYLHNIKYGESSTRVLFVQLPCNKT